MIHGQAVGLQPLHLRVISVSNSMRRFRYFRREGQGAWWLRAQRGGGIEAISSPYCLPPWPGPPGVTSVCGRAGTGKGP